MTTSEQQLRTLPEKVAAGGPDWLTGLRRSAAEHLRDKGFPTKKTEAWRFTPVEPLARAAFAPPPAAEATRAREIARARVGDDGTHQVVLADGRPLLEGSGVAPGGTEVRSLADVLEQEPELLKAHLGAEAPREDFAALNAALFRDGLFVRIRAGQAVERPVHLVHVGLAGDAPTAAYPRVLVVVEPGAEGRLIESFVVGEGAEHLTNVVTEVVMAENAHLDHLRVTEGTSTSLHAGMLAVRQAKDSVYRSRVVTLGGALSRLDLRARLEGEGAECHLEGVYYATGSDHVDHHTCIEHAEPHGTSSQVYRGILDDRARGVFDGTVVVRPHAQHTNAHQENRNLLLSDDAGIHTKPHLEIEADDVKCSHGATIGSLDASQLFYLRTRGVGAEQARALLTYAFVRALIDRIPHDAIRDRLAGALLDRLPHGEAIREQA